MRASDFDYHLPTGLIAQAPLDERDASRLLHARRGQPELEHLTFRTFPTLLRAGDVLVFNDSRVMPARLLGKKDGTGGKVELLLVRPEADLSTAMVLTQQASQTSWRCIGQASKGLRPGAKLAFDGGLTATIEASFGGGEYRVRFTSSGGSLEAAIEQAGRLPLPPYIERAPGASDSERYQTVFAREKGSVAAPTAGLHFTQALLTELAERGIERAFVTLEVGPGTFLPVREEELSKHHMHSERFHVSAEAAQCIAKAKREGRRVVAVGTTVVRTLESSAQAVLDGREVHSDTALFITPGYSFRVVDALLTNFHLPRSTLLMLVSAFLGQGETRAAYEAAVAERYRFFSYGDAMFVE